MTKLISRRGRTQIPVVQSTDLQLFASCKNDPVLFINSFIKIAHPIKSVCSFILHPKQKDYVDHLHNNHGTIAMFCRQAGGTSTSLAFLLWEVMVKPNHHTAILSENHSMRAHNSYLVQFMINHFPEFLRTQVSKLTQHCIEFHNGSKLLFDTANQSTFRGRTFDRVFVDQIAYVREDEQPQLWANLSHVSFRGGAVNILSVPKKSGDIFHQHWATATCGPKTRLEAFTCTIDDATWSNIDKNQMRQMIGDEDFRRQYMCEFV
jgi:hypothetical protein